ncbi:MAG: flagellar FliJ family protein [Methylophilaceae bacterium]
MTTSKVDEMIVNEIAAKELRIATGNFKESDTELKDAEFKYHKLVQFRGEYVDRFDNEMKHYVAEDTHQGFRSFFSRLDVVIFEQQDIVANCERKAKIQRQLMEECQKKMQSLDDVQAQEEMSA